MHLTHTRIHTQYEDIINIFDAKIIFSLSPFKPNIYLNKGL